MDPVCMQPVGLVRTCYPDKFGVPRQPGMVRSAWGRLEFREEYRRPEAIRGLEGFSHLWLVFLFDGVREEEVRLSVRPPRLGGNEKLGVFATRSPFRPNRIGLSVCRLERIEHGGREGPMLHLSGLDVVDGTPVLDVKPYVPYADAVPGATGGFAAEPPRALEVTVAEEWRERFESLPEQQQRLVRESLQWDPRPAYHQQDRTYHLRVEQLDVAWVMREGRCEVVGIREADPEG